MSNNTRLNLVLYIRLLKARTTKDQELRELAVLRKIMDAGREAFEALTGKSQVLRDAIDAAEKEATAAIVDGFDREVARSTNQFGEMATNEALERIMEGLDLQSSQQFSTV